MKYDEKLTDKLIKYICSFEPVLVGTTDLIKLNELFTIPEDLFDGFNSGISIALPLPTKAIDLISYASPGPLYAHAYKTVNQLLDYIIYNVSAWLISRGFHAQPIPASLSIDNKNFYGNLSHKAVALASGLGWIGRSTLLVTPKYGPRIRLATILTDANLKPTGEPMENNCGDCIKCIESCPQKALKYVDFKYYPSKREDALNPKACRERLERMSKNPLIKVLICGICIKVCPIGYK